MTNDGPTIAPVDPRFASADALLEYYNQVLTQQPKLDSREVLSLMFAETPLQERLLALYRDSLPLLELDDACWEQYGAGLNPGTDESPFEPARHRATMTESDNDRAKARRRRNDGSRADVYCILNIEILSIHIIKFFRIISTLNSYFFT